MLNVDFFLISGRMTQWSSDLAPISTWLLAQMAQGNPLLCVGCVWGLRANLANWGERRLWQTTSSTAAPGLSLRLNCKAWKNNSEMICWFVHERFLYIVRKFLMRLISHGTEKSINLQDSGAWRVCMGDGFLRNFAVGPSELPVSCEFVMGIIFCGGWWWWWWWWVWVWGWGGVGGGGWGGLIICSFTKLSKYRSMA